MYAMYGNGWFFFFYKKKLRQNLGQSIAPFGLAFAMQNLGQSIAKFYFVKLLRKQVF